RVGRELRDEGYNMSQSGGVNLTREPRGGRTFEYQGEDPLLAGTLAGNVVRGIQSEHIIGDLKHCALNDRRAAAMLSTQTLASGPCGRPIYAPSRSLLMSPMLVP